MKKLLTMTAVAVAVSLSGFAYAGDGCCTSKTVAKTSAGADCSTAKTTQVADKASCTASSGDIVQVSKTEGACTSDVSKVAGKASCTAGSGDIVQVSKTEGACTSSATKVAGKSACSAGAGDIVQVSKTKGGECCSTVSKASKVAGASSCGSECSHGMVKGGGADDNVAMGYGLGQKVPNFELSDTKGNSHSLADYKGEIVVLTFYNQDCPYVVEFQDRFAAFAKDYADKGVKVLAIDAGTNVKDDARAKYADKMPFPMLVNKTSETAINFAATRTPEVFILCQEGTIQYHGAFDNGRAGAEEGKRVSWAKDAVDSLLDGQQPAVRETKAFGCSIKLNRDTLASMEAKSGDKS